MAHNYTKWPKTIPNGHKIQQHNSLQVPPKFAQIRSFGIKIFHLANPLPSDIWVNENAVKGYCEPRVRLHVYRDTAGNSRRCDQIRPNIEILGKNSQKFAQKIISLGNKLEFLLYHCLQLLTER
jgi:hypothetical protein